MSFVSGLYFRGKLAYARTFARPPDPNCPVVAGGVLVITPDAGLLPADAPCTVAALQEAAQVEVSAENTRYRVPLETTARALCERIGPGCEVVLLGSIASGKYVDVLSAIFGQRLIFPLDFVGRGDMSRGGLMLRAAQENRELGYVAITADVIRRGPRPPKLPPLPRMVTKARGRDAG